MAYGSAGSRPSRSCDEPWDFIAEHFRRRDLTATATDSSNRRFGGDVAVRVPPLAGARFYYSIVFEDIRKHLFDAVRYDADHLLGVELAAIGPCRLHGLTVPIESGLSVEGEVLAERVDSFAFDPSVNRTNAGVRLSLIWLGPELRPRARAGSGAAAPSR